MRGRRTGRLRRQNGRRRTGTRSFVGARNSLPLPGPVHVRVRVRVQVVSGSSEGYPRAAPAQVRGNTETVAVGGGGALGRCIDLSLLLAAWAVHIVHNDLEELPIHGRTSRWLSKQA